MGFNTAGAVSRARRVMLARRHLPPNFVVGVNIGRGRGTPADRAVDDYLAAARVVAPVADYLVVNVSSPNTPGLRDLQRPDTLAGLVSALLEAGREGGSRRPLLVKLSPDLDEADLDAIVPALVGAGVAGLVVANTTTQRQALRSAEAREEGGLSGAPLRDRMLELVRRARGLAGPGTVIIGSGGIASAADVEAAYDAGADLVQLWTGLVYRGPGLVGESVAVRAGGRPAL
jgi:dihydroorotate dehydrogenase